MPSLSSTPYPAATELRRWTLDSFPELRTLRSSLREALRENASDGVEDLCDRVTVVATELATNALRHGLPPTVVSLLREDSHLILDVADHAREVAPEVDPDRPLGAGGLGLQLAKTFSIEVGWYRTDHTKHVWASFPG